MVALSGCATLKPDERALLLEHNVSPETFDRMRYNEPLTVPDIIELSKRGVPVPFIIHYLRRTETSYPLSPSDITELKNAGVSPDVVNYLLATPSIYSPQRYPYPYYPPPYSYGPYYYDYPPVIVSGPYDRWHHW